MMKPKEDAILVYSSIKKESGLNDDALAVLNITTASLSKALQDCYSKGMSRKKAQAFLLKLWKSSSPNDYASPKEMELLGFSRIDGKWILLSTGLEITDDEVKTKTFQEIEALAIESLNKNTQG